MEPAPCGCHLNQYGRGHWSACWEHPDNRPVTGQEES